MRRFGGTLAALLVLGYGSPGAAAAQTWSDRAASAEQASLAWLHHAWNVVQQEGAPAAERVIQEAPKKFKAVRKNLEGLSKKVAQFADGHHLQEKKALLLEFWRIRDSVNIMALLNPDTLETLTGIDHKEFQAMQAQLARVQKTLGR